MTAKYAPNFRGFYENFFGVYLSRSVSLQWYSMGACSKRHTSFFQGQQMLPSSRHLLERGVFLEVIISYKFFLSYRLSIIIFS